MRTLTALTVLFCFALGVAAGEPAVTLTQKPTELVYGLLPIPTMARADVHRVELSVNGQKVAEKGGRYPVFQADLGKYIRRLRIRATAYDAANEILGIDEMVVNDPQPPFRVRLHAPRDLPPSGAAELSASLTVPSRARIEGVDFYVGESRIGTDVEPPYAASFDVDKFPEIIYARATARASGGLEANDIAFWGSNARESIEVTLKQLPLSTSGKLSQPLRRDELTLIDNGKQREIEALTPATDQPLNVILLIDASESMLPEIPMVQKGAKEFAHSIIRPGDRLAVVAFHQRLFWLTPFTSDLTLIDAAVDRIMPQGQTHLYDAVIKALFELQKLPGRRAVVVFSDGIDSGGDFSLDHLIHYARYSGVPIYPVIRNVWLSRYLRLGLGGFQAKRFAEIARESGATYFIVEKSSELPKVYRRIAEELSQQYLMMFYAESTGDDLWHGIRLDTTRRGVHLRTPRGYFP